MYCQECGNQLPDNAKFCPECGTPTGPLLAGSNTYGVGVLRVSRFNSVMASAIPTKVYVDGDLKNSVGNGDSISMQLPDGLHTVELKTPGNKGIIRNVNITPDTETEFRFRLSMAAEGFHEVIGVSDSPQYSSQLTRSEPIVVQVHQRPVSAVKQGKVCPRCGGTMTIQTITEDRHAGCFTVLFYIILCLTVLGILIVIPLALRKRTETVTYAVCQTCGHRIVMSRSG